MDKEDKVKKLSLLKQQMQKDEELPLRDGATNLVFGEGSVDAKIFFLGEGPGYWEDIKARPFVGNSGMLLNKLLQLIEIERKDVFITNVICFRPPKNRDPSPEEINAFKSYVDQIIKIVNPKVMVTLGRFSMAKFLPGVRISSVHGKIHNVKWGQSNLVVIPMYHPAAALRNGQIMLQIRQDFRKIPVVLEEIAKKVNAKQMNLV